MGTIYRVTIQGRTFESKDLKRLLARAVSEKRSIQQRIRIQGRLAARFSGGLPGGSCWHPEGCGAAAR